MMTAASELAFALRHDDPADVYLEQASEYLEIAREAERRALRHADRGDLLVAYDEAMDARWGLCVGAVFVVAWLATIARRPTMRLDCASTDGEQLGLDSIRGSTRGSAPAPTTPATETPVIIERARRFELPTFSLGRSQSGDCDAVSSANAGDSSTPDPATGDGK